MSYKIFANGNPLQASELNVNLMQQAIAVFTDATARDAAISVPVNGQFAYLTGTSNLTKYTGAAWGDAIEISDLASLVVDATTARTLTSADSGKTIQFTSGSAVTITVDASTDIPVGGRVDILADGAGAVTVTASTATVAAAETSTTSGSFTIGAQYSAATLLCVATDTYRLIGNVAVV